MQQFQSSEACVERVANKNLIIKTNGAYLRSFFNRTEFESDMNHNKTSEDSKHVDPVRVKTIIGVAALIDCIGLREEAIRLVDSIYAILDEAASA